MPSPRPRRSRSPGAAWALVLVLFACRSAPREEEGTVEEFGHMVAEGGAEPVLGREDAGPARSGEDDPVGIDAEVAAELAAQEVTDNYDVPQNPYIRFGERIVIGEGPGGERVITKPFPMPPGKAARIVQLIRALDPFPLVERTPGPISEVPLDAVSYVLLENWDQEYYANLSEQAIAQNAPQAAAPVNLSDMLVVTAPAELLAEFEDFIDLFSAGVPQIELEAKIIEIVETDTLDVGVRPFLDTTDPNNPVAIPQFQFGSSNFVQSLGFNVPNAADATEALLALGAVQDGLVFKAIIEAIQNWQNVTIETRPKTVVRAGGLARLESTVEIPFFDIKTLSDTGAFTTGISYKSTGVKLYITPRVVGSKALALDVQLENSQAVSFQSVFAAASGNDVTEIAVPVIAYRTARTIVYLEPGQTLLIGGLTQETQQEAVDKVPILGDIPLLGFFFRSTFTEKRKEHVIFAISPRIIQRGDLRTVL